MKMWKDGIPAMALQFRLWTRTTFRTAPMIAAMTIASVCAFAVYAKQSGESCRSNLKQYALGMLMYTQDYDERFPPMKTPAQVTNRVMPYIKNRAVFSCPDSGSEYLPNPALNFVATSSVKSPASMMMLRDAKPH